MKKKARLTVETERLLVISPGHRAAERWCEQCHALVRMIGVEAAANVAGTTQRAIFQLAECGQVHFVETAEGRALFCPDSLTKPALLSNRHK